MLIFSSKNQKISKSFYDHHQNVADCFENFEKFMDILFEEKVDEHALESAKVAIDDNEAKADIGLRHAIDLMKEAFLPVTRKNLIALVESTDEIANNCQDVARQVTLEKIRIPKELHSDIKKVIQITDNQLTLLYSAIDKLLNNFKLLTANKKILDDIRADESSVDRIETMLHERIFELDLSLCEKIYYRDLVADICQTSDIIEDIADQIQVMLVEREA